MVIGNGFFTDTRQDAVKEMQERSHCRVEHCPFPTIGNIDYYISEKGDLYGVQNIQGKQLTRTRKVVKNKGGMTARLSSAPNKETYIPLQVLTYCTFTIGEWKPDVQLEFKNGNQYDVRPDNLQPKQKYIPPEWSERMTWREKIYKANFMHVAWSVNYYTELDIEDCKDLVQSAFIYLCTDGYRPSQHKTDIVGLWIEYARMRAIDYIRRRWIPDSDLVERQVNQDKPYEIDLFHLQPGEKQSTYLRMWAEGNTPTEIAEVCGCKPATVSASVTRSIRFLQRYFKKEIQRTSLSCWK